MPKNHFVRPRVLLAAAAILLLASPTLAPAQVVEYEGFDYSGASLDGQNGGSGWAGNAWTDPENDTPLSDDGVSLTFPASVSHQPAGSRVVFTSFGAAERRLGASMALNTEGQVYYVSALVKREGDFRIEFGNGTYVRWQFGGQGDAATAAATVGINGDTIVNDIFPVGETVFLVCKMVTHSTANDQAYLNVYRAGDIVPGAEPATWQVAANNGSGITLDRVQIRNLSDLPLEVDELRIGAKYLEVSGGLVGGPPLVTRQPASVADYQGSSVQFLVEVTGKDPFSYQWRLEGTPLTDATNALLALTNIQPALAGAYTVVIANSLGKATSAPALLTLIPLTNVTVGLQGQWHFDEGAGLTVFDATTNHNDGTLLNFPGDDTQWVPSDYNGALMFSAPFAQAVEVPNSPSIGSKLVNRFTVAAWIYPNVTLGINNNSYRLLEKESSFFFLQGDGNASALGIGGMNVLVKKGGANLSAGIGQALEAYRWYHLAATFDGATLRIYLDGELKGTRAVAAPIDSSTMPLRIGSDYNPAGTGIKYFDGAIDEVGIWDRALGQLEILGLAGLSGIPTVVDQPQPQTRYAGGSAMFTVRARGLDPMRYLWFRGANEIRTATGPALTLLNVQPGDAGEYRCRISNEEGETFTEPATLTVLPVAGLEDALAARWTFDDGSGAVAADSSGHGLDGQLNFADASSAWVAGQVKGALAFDGIQDWVAVANSPDLDVGTDATFTFWIQPAAYGTLENMGTYTRNISRIVRKTGHFEITLIDDPGSVRGTLQANGVSAPQQNIVQLNEWQHFAVVCSGGWVSFYKNGFRVGDPVAASIGPVGADSVVLGASTDPARPALFAGAMDEAGIWGRALSEAEILALAGRDVAGKPVIVTQPESATRYQGGSVAFLVEATGKLPLTYAWQHNGAPLPNSDTNRLVLANLTLAEAGAYMVSVQNGLGSAVSAPPAVLAVQQITNVTTGLVAYWPLDETDGVTLVDASGHGHDAQLQENATAVPDILGVVGGAFNFDGVDDYAVVPHAPDLSLLDQASFAVWISPSSLGAQGTDGWGRLLRKDINYDVTVFQANSNLRFIGRNKTLYDTPVGTVVSNEWQHFAVVLKDNTVQFFKNGRALGNPVTAYLGPAVTNDLIIGNFGPNLLIKRVFSGYMDELGIWDRALNAAEIDGIYQNGVLGRPLNAPFEPLEIKTVECPSPTQVRLVFSSPYTGRQHVIQRKGQLDAADWTTETQVTFRDLGGGLNQAVFGPAGSPAFYRVAALPPAPIFSEDFEGASAYDWYHDGSGDTWELGAPVNGPGAAFSGKNAYATRLDGIIEPYSDCYLLSPLISLAGVHRATLTFQEWRNVDPDPNLHRTVVTVLDAWSLAPLQQLSVQAGATAGWQLRSLPLPPQILGRDVMLEFRLVSDGFNLLEGWYLDDVKIIPE